MVCCITVGKLDKCFFAMLFGSVFCFLNRLLNQYKCKLTNHIIVHNIFISISKLLGIIPYLITRKLYKDDPQIEKLMRNDITHEEISNETKRIKQTKWRFLFISAIAYLANQVTYIISLQIKSNVSILNIIFSSLFYYLFFKSKLYMHHYLSCGFIIIIGIIVDLILGNLQNDLTEHTGLFFLRVLREVIYSLSSNIDKYAMEKKFISVYLILFSNGVFTVIILVIFAIFDYFFFHIDKYKDYFEEFNSTELLVALGTIITQFTLKLCIALTNKYFSPCHIFIIFVFGQLGVYINIDFNWKMTVAIICLLFILFLSLIFNEIFEINVCGLSDNTKKNISKRSVIDDLDMIAIKKETMESESSEGTELISKDNDNMPNKNDEGPETNLNINQL